MLPLAPIQISPEMNASINWQFVFYHLPISCLLVIKSHPSYSKLFSNIQTKSPFFNHNSCSIGKQCKDSHLPVHSDQYSTGEIVSVDNIYRMPQFLVQNTTVLTILVAASLYTCSASHEHQWKWRHTSSRPISIKSFVFIESHLTYFSHITRASFIQLRPDVRARISPIR